VESERVSRKEIRKQGSWKTTQASNREQRLHKCNVEWRPVKTSVAVGGSSVSAMLFS
jgi:hypothetical protein